MSVSRSLRAYQRKVYYETLTRPWNALFLDMRLGKTLISIRSIDTRFQAFKRVLIVCPYSAFNAWETELIKENHGQDTIILLIGPKEKRRKKLIDARNSNKVQWFILNIEGWRVIPEIASYKWDAMIADESYFLQAPPHINTNKKTQQKNPSTSKFFTTNFRDVPYKYILSGTPAPESELNYFMQLLFLDKSILSESNYWKFRFNNFVQYVPHEYAITQKGRAFLTSRLSSCAYFLSRKDVNLGGEKIYETRRIALDKKTRKIYDDIWNRFVVRVENEFRDVTEIGGARFQWARRLLGGFVVKEFDINENEQKDFDFIFPGKMEELNTLLNGELYGQKIVIWAHFTKEIDLLMQYMKTSRHEARCIDGRINPLQRAQNVKDFQTDAVQYLICQPQAAQYSFDMSAADTEIFYSSPVALKDRLQSEDRLISSKTNSVLVLDFVCENTLEEDIVESLRKKENKQALIKRLVQRLTLTREK